jgi:hypothetical protein
MEKNSITVDEAAGSIPINDRSVVLELHNKAVNAGYTALSKLSEKTLAGILSSRKCRGKANGCTAGIMFTHADKKYLLCRHGMHFRGITSGDIQTVWKLLNTESTYR